MPSSPTHGISFTDLVEGYTETFGLDGASIVRPVQTAWGTRRAFIRDMLGENYRLGTTILRSNPDLFLNTDFDPKLYCTNLELSSKGLPNAAGANPVGHSFGNVDYMVHYNTLPYDINENAISDNSTSGELVRNVERTFNFAAENLQIPGAAFRWTTMPLTAIFAPPPKIFPTIELTYIWHRVPLVPTANINTCVGRVNSAAFDDNVFARVRGVPSGGFPAQTLLFLGAEPKVRIVGFVAQQGGIATEWDITYKFLYRNNGDAGGGVFFGWNHLFRPSANAFQLVTDNGLAGGNRLYSTANFNLLFQMPS